MYCSLVAFLMAMSVLSRVGKLPQTVGELLSSVREIELHRVYPRRVRQGRSEPFILLHLRSMPLPGTSRLSVSRY